MIDLLAAIADRWLTVFWLLVVIVLVAAVVRDVRRARSARLPVLDEGPRSSFDDIEFEWPRERNVA